MAEYIVSTKTSLGYEGDDFACGVKKERIIRCGDCRHMCEEMDCYTCYHRHPEGLMVTPNGFCDCGEPKEDE